MRDWIRGLPDSLLVHILSLLPTKDAVSTCLLSKRWTSLWHHITMLKFDSDSFSSREFLCQFVDAALLLVDLDHVHTFVLSCKPFTGLSNVKLHLWLQALLLHNSIKHLELSFFHPFALPRITIPSFVFKSNTITVLKLCIVKLPDLSKFHLPYLQLEALQLESVTFSSSQCLQLLLSHCLNLKELKLSGIKIPDRNLPLHIGRLQHLLVAEVPADIFVLDGFSNGLSNVRYLYLAEFEFEPALDLPTFPNLIHLHIVAFRHINWTIVSCLHRFPKLQSLTIGEFVSYLSDDQNEGFVEGATVEVPPSVSCHLKEIHWLIFRGSEPEFELLRYLMGNAWALRSVCINLYSSSKKKRLKVRKKLLSSLMISANCRLQIR